MSGAVKNDQTLEDYAKRYGPLGFHVSQFCNSVTEVVYKVYQTTSVAFSALADFGSKLSLLSVLFVPLRISNIIQIVQSNDRTKNKMIDVAIELGGIFNGAIVLGSFFLSNMKEVTRLVPALVGLSTLFQCVDVYKKVMTIRRTEGAVKRLGNDEQFGLFYERIRGKQLTDQDKRLLQLAFKFDTDAIDPFCDTVAKLDNKEKVREHLKGRVERSLRSHKVALVATIVETLASVLIFAAFFVAPPIGALLAIVNASVLGTTAVAKISLFVYDYFTRSSSLVAESDNSSEIELQSITQD